MVVVALQISVTVAIDMLSSCLENAENLQLSYVAM